MDSKKTKSIMPVILKALQKRWLTSVQLQKVIKAKTGKLYSESTITARIRDLRKPEYGGHKIIKKSVPWSRSPVYVHAHYQDVAAEARKSLLVREAESL